jgi:CMP-N-acetylneuraminic acid synthetase
MRIVALLPMKANSERVKGKNFRSFCGKPLFRWMLDTLLKVDRISDVIINTDARDILIKHGLDSDKKINIRDRAAPICGDFVSMNDVIADDVENVDADIYIMTHTTNPLLSTTSINKALDSYLEHQADGYDSLFSVNKIQTRFYDGSCNPINHNPADLIRTQDLTPWFEENSNLYIFSRESFAKSGARIGVKPIMFETPKTESIDIDTPEDWELAQTIVAHRQSRGRTS